jgi:hypothetical protein
MSDRQFRELYSWKPIETAPKDGTPVLVAAAGCPWHPMLCHFEGSWGSLNPDMSFTALADQPTHWMPLPEPPATDDKGNG